MINLTETKRLKDAIDKNPERFRQIIEDTYLGVCVTDENGIFVAVNENYLKIYKYMREEMIGKNFLMVVPEEFHEQLKEMHDEFIKVQIEIFEHFKVKDKFGNLIEIDVDAGFTDKINGRPHKLTFIQPSEKKAR
ncbi:MAG: PAS domain S-box protein [Flammeovirgaceae bacterium]|nr:PAS domain S-box protein [Flammeovirgaceae bacterium]MDW8286949.1 PAS domain S-box protein [Flammeovirgaceae bacterium]